MKIFLSHYRHTDYERELYLPLRASALNTSHELTLPHEHGSVVSTKEMVDAADVLVAEVTSSATGVGIEIGWAHSRQIPIICFFKAGSKPSNSLQFVTRDVVEYTDSADLVAKLEKYIAERV